MPELKIDQGLIDDLVRREIAAQDLQAQPIEKKKKEGVGLLAKILMGAGLGADVATTMYGEGTGATTEANPALKPLGGMSAKVRAPLVAGAEMGGMMLLNKMIGKKHPKIMKALTMGVGAAHGGTAVHNMMEINKGKAALAARPMSSPSNTPPAPGMVQLPDGSWMNPDYFGK